MSDSDVNGPIYTSAIQFQINGKTRGKRVDEKTKKTKAGSEKPETAPELVVKPRRQFVDHGGNAKFKASFDGSVSTKLSWSKGGKTLSASEDGHYKIYEQDGFHFLEVAMVTMDDHGEYTVTVENSVGSDKASADLDVFEKPQLLSREAEPSWEKSLKDVKAHEEDAVLELVCVSKDLLKSSAQWFHDGKEVMSGFHTKVSHEGQKTSLVIKGVKPSDGGQFKCVMTGSNGRLESSCKLTVLPPEKLAPPVFVKELHDMEVEDGDKLELVVEVKGTPPVRVFWFHNNEEITLTNPHFLLASLGNVHTLTFPHATAQCAGELVCEAYNDCGDTDTFCVIDVKELENPELPHFVMRPCNCTVEEGDEATFICKMRGQPMPTVVWEREGVEITDSSKHKTSNMKELHSLTIHSVDPLDKGEYTCHLHNTQGNTSHTFQLFLMSDIIASSKPARHEAGQRRHHHQHQYSSAAAAIPKIGDFSATKKEVKSESQTERFEKTETTERPKYSHSFMQPKVSNDNIVRSSSVRAKVEALAPPDTDKTQPQDALQNSPLFKRVRERFNTKGTGRSYDYCSSGTSGDESDNHSFFGSGTVDFRERDRDSSKKGKGSDKFRGAFTAREAMGSNDVIENGLRNLQNERNCRNVLSRGSGDYKSGLSNVSSWKSNNTNNNNNNPQGSLAFRESVFQRSGNKSMSHVGLKAVNKSLVSLGQRNNVFQNSMGVPGGCSPREKLPEPTYSPSSSLQFESNDLRKVTSGVLNSQNKHSRESIDNAKGVIGGNVYRAEMRPTNMFEPTERPFNTQPSTQPVLHHARLTTLKNPNTDSNTSPNSESNASHSSKSSDTKPTNFNNEAIPSIKINTPLQMNVNLTSKLSDRISKLEKHDTGAPENKTIESRPHSRLKGCAGVKTGNNQIQHIIPDSTTLGASSSSSSSSTSTNGHSDSIISKQKESGSVFTWGKRPSKTSDEMIEDTKLVSKIDQINKKPIPNVTQMTTKSPAVTPVHSPNLTSRTFSNKSDVSVSSSRKPTPTTTSSSSSSPPTSGPSDFRSIKLKPTQKINVKESSSPIRSSEKLRKSKFLSKSTENVFGDVKLRPVSNNNSNNARPKSEFNPQNVGRLRLKSKSTNFSDINLVSDSEDPDKSKEEEMSTTNNTSMESSDSDSVENSDTESKPEKTRGSGACSEDLMKKAVESKLVLNLNAKRNNNVNFIDDKPNSTNSKENEVEEKHTTENTSDNSKRTEFMDKIRKWKTADFTEKLNKMESGSQTSREPDPIDKDTSPAASSTAHRHSIPKSPGTSFLDNVPHWVKQKALNKRNSFQADKSLQPSNSNTNLHQTYRASLINTGEFSGGLHQNDSSSSNLNKTFHNFHNKDFDSQSDKYNKDDDSEIMTSKLSSSTKSDSLKPRNEKLMTSSRLGHLRSAPDLKEKSKFENSGGNDTQSQLDWRNRKPIRNIEQMIKANSQSRIDKSYKEENKPDWARLKSPRDIKHEGQILKGDSSISSAKYTATSISSKDSVHENNTKHSDKPSDPTPNIKDNHFVNRIQHNTENEKSIKNNSSNVTKSKITQESEPAVSISRLSPRLARNEQEVTKDSSEESLEKSRTETKGFRDENEQSNNASRRGQGFQVSNLNTQTDTKNDPECKIVSTPPTPDANDNDDNTEDNQKEDIQKILSSQSQYSSSASSTNRQSSLAKAIASQKQSQPEPEPQSQPQSQQQTQPQSQPQPHDQQPLKTNPVRPSWMKQKSLRHIPIYPIHDNELSPRYEPFRKSMDDTSSTNSVSSLASDASGLTTDSGYGKSVLTEDIMNSSKDTLPGRGKLDSVESSEEQSYVADRHNKSGSNDNVFKLETSAVDADSDVKKDNGSKQSYDQIQDPTTNDKPQLSETSKNPAVFESNTTVKEPLNTRFERSRLDDKFGIFKNESKTNKNMTTNGGATSVSGRMSKYEKASNDHKNSDINSVDTSGANTNTIRAPKSEFLKKRLSLTPLDDTAQETGTTNSSQSGGGVSTSISRTSAVRPKVLNISPNTERRNRTNGLITTTTKDQIRSGLSSTMPNIQKDASQTRNPRQNTDLALGNGKRLEQNSTSSKSLLSKQNDLDFKTPSDSSQSAQGSDTVSDGLPATSSPTVEESCPRFELPLNDVAVTYGSKATLRCHVFGTPIPEIQWLYDRKPIEPSNEISTTISSSTGICTLTVLETFTDHIGTYSCLASNSAGSVTTSARLTIATFKKSEGLALEGPVSLPPRTVSLTPKVATLSRDSTLTLTLNFVGEPTPTVTWKKGEKELSHGDGRVSIETTKGCSILTIDHVTSMDAGKMTAVITSSIGSDLTTANVCVEDIPGPPVGRPHIYGINRESASLSWCGPSSSGGSTINYYVIEAKTRTQTAWDVLVPQCKELSYHVFGLQPSATYQFRVRAANKKGLGPPSEPSERVITSDPFSGSLDESDGCPDVFTPTMEYRSPDELPFDPREVQLNNGEKFEDSYDLGPVVGKGKFGTVYKCTQKEDPQARTWAAKVLKCREKDKAAIRHEVEVMNRLRHPKLLMLWDAFESPRQMVLVMEFIGAGELFERVIGEDFVLTERDCVHFLRQICEGVSYMHSTHVLHLDLKPENILCIAENSNRIKIIDFGLARIFKPGDSTRVLMGTPEFIAPEVINYDEVSFATDMWSIGVICYVLLSGLSPFLGDNDTETLSNVTIGEFDFDDEAFDEISDTAKDFISKLLIKRKEKRLLTEDCLKHPWLAGDEVDGMRYKRLNTDRLKHFMVRRKWLKTGNAVLAVSRLMKTTMSLGSFTSRSRSDSNNSANDSDVTTPRSPDEMSQPSSATANTTTTAQLHHNGSGDEKTKTDANSSSSENQKPLGVVGENNVIPVHKDQNDNKLAAGEVITTSVVGEGGEEEHFNGSLPLHQNSSDSVLLPPSSTCNNNRVSDNGINAAPISKDLQDHNDIMNSSNTITASSSSNSHNNNNSSSTSSSISSSSTLCPSSTSTLPPSSSSLSTSTPTTTATATTQQPPNFTRQMADGKAFVGDNVRFDASLEVLEGAPFPEVEWYFEDDKLEIKGNNSKYSIESNQSKGTCSLIIRSVEEDDDGEYVCKAVNSSGEVTCSAELSVLEM